MPQNQWPKTTPQKIIVRMPNWLGDLVMATPVLAELRSFFPHTHLTAMCQANVAPLLKLDPHLNEVYSYHRPSGWIHQKQHTEIIETLRLGEYDLGVLLPNSLSSAWWFWRGNVRNRIGFASNGRSLLLNKAVPFPKQKETEHLVVTYKRLLEPIGIPLSDSAPELYLGPEEVQAAQDMVLDKAILFGKEKIVGINPGAAYGSAKCWLPERFIALSKRLLQDPRVSLLYFGDAAGKPLVDSICSSLSSGRVLNLAGKTTIRELLALIRLCDVFLTNDSGPMHMAAALKVPLVALFGSTNDTKTGPYQTGIVIHKHVECSPCYQRVCPIDFRCMKQIEVDEVFEAVKSLYGEGENGPGLFSAKSK